MSTRTTLLDIDIHGVALVHRTYRRDNSPSLSIGWDTTEEVRDHEWMWIFSGDTLRDKIFHRQILSHRNFCAIEVGIVMYILNERVFGDRDAN
jgi:hypothetical protein